ncbi:hypothetical protein P7C73_g3328, partial [Tremellales sp. Uapishka_1]
MPKEPVVETTGEPKAALKRGDACLYCRKRRIKCSATKPSCQHCVKLKRECIYDSGKSVSRVKQLEERVAELEGYLKTGTEGERRESASTESGDPIVHRPGMPHHSSTDSEPLPSSSTMYGFTDQQNVDINMLDSFVSPSFLQDTSFPVPFSAFGASIFATANPAPPPASVGQNNNDILPEDLFDFSTLDPSFMNLVNSFEAATTGGSETVPSTSFAGHRDSNPMSRPLLPAAVPHANPASIPHSNPPNSQTYPPNPDFPLFQSPVESSRPWASPSTNISTSSKFSSNPISSSGPTSTSASESVPYHAYVTEYNVAEEDVEVRGERVAPLPPPHLPEGAGWKGDPELEELGLVGGWFDAADLPKQARDHLLNLFFGRMRMFGQEFHIPRFFASLALPPQKRPHPCLLYSMYLMSSRISSSPSIRSLEQHFYSIAAKQLEEAISRADRLLDATKAATILAVYKYSHARYHEGWMMTGQAAREDDARLAISCGLHQIASSVFKPSPVPTDGRAALMAVMRQRAFVVPPPADAVELGERIWSFWSIYTVDRCGSISAQWPPAIPDDIVSTPYPRSLPEYELGLVTQADDYTIGSLYDNPQPPRSPFYGESTYIELRLRAIAILERSSKLMYAKPEAPAGSTSSSSSNSPHSAIDEYLLMQNMAAFMDVDEDTTSPAKGANRTAQIRCPKAYEEVRQALLRVEADMPAERRTNWEAWDGKVQAWHFSGLKKDIVTLHFILGCAWMFLFDVYSYKTENTRAVAVARRLVFTIRTVMQDDIDGDIDVFIAMTWSFIVKILIREAKRLQSLGDVLTAGPLEAEIETIVQALKIFGKRYGIASMQATRVERYRASTLEEMSFMEGDNFDEDHVPVERIPGAMGTD